MHTPQKTIKNFIVSLASHSYGYSSDVGLKMLDDAMKADQLKAEKRSGQKSSR